jgi:hypothetical protein
MNQCPKWTDIRRYTIPELLFVHEFHIGTYQYMGAGVTQSVQFLATDWATGLLRFYIRQRPQIFPVTSVSRPALGLTQPPVQWVPGLLSPGVKGGRGVTLTTHPHLVPRSWMSRSCNSSPPCASTGVMWDYFNLLINIYYTMYLFFIFLVVYPCFASSKYAGTLNFHFEHCNELFWRKWTTYDFSHFQSREITGQIRSTIQFVRESTP